MLIGLKWLGTGTGVGGALLLAANTPLSGWGFVLFLISSMSWTLAAWQARDLALGVLQLTFTGINILGIYHWLLAT